MKSHDFNIVVAAHVANGQEYQTTMIKQLKNVANQRPPRSSVLMKTPETAGVYAIRGLIQYKDTILPV